MNTTKKGNQLEQQVFDLFSNEIESGKFLADKKHCNIYQKKGYYSQTRKKEIIFDIAIEVFLPTQSRERYAFLILIECKNYGHKVPVDDVEEFYAKIQQISPAATKGIVVSTNAFQEGAFEFAKTTGMGLVRYFDRSSLDWILNRSPSFLVKDGFSIQTVSNAYKGLNTEDFKSSHYDCYCYVNSTYTNSWKEFFIGVLTQFENEGIQEFLEQFKNSSAYSFSQVKYIETSSVESLSKSILQKVGYKVGPVSLESVCKHLEELSGLKVTYDNALAVGVLGQVSFEPLVVSIDVNQCKSDTILRFTLAHEIGHIVMGHSRYMNGEKCHEYSLELENIVEIGIKDIVRMEWQANYFASTLLVPKDGLINIISGYISSENVTNRGHGIIYLDEQKCNQEIYYQITNKIMKRFNVSRSVAKIRLAQLGLLNEVKPVNQSSQTLFKRVND